jgi:hypothetical protein
MSGKGFHPQVYQTRILSMHQRATPIDRIIGASPNLPNLRQEDGLAD